MTHVIYLKSHRKGAWLLFSSTSSAETASSEIEEALKQARKEGHENPEAIIQTFDNSFYIPHILTNVKKQNTMLN